MPTHPIPAKEVLVLEAHAKLVLRAEKWLRKHGCGITLRDPFRANTQNGEHPDAIGWRDGISILVECKASRSDFLADRSKPFRINPNQGMGDWRFYLSPPDMIRPEDLPNGWGLLWTTARGIQDVHGVPTNCEWWSKKPFAPCKRSETTILASALRRLDARGYLGEIYEATSINLD